MRPLLLLSELYPHIPESGTKYPASHATESIERLQEGGNAHHVE